MRVTALELRDFRSHERASFVLGDRLTVVTGPNGSGKTNLLEALYFGATTRSPRTATDRELVRRGAKVARVVLDFEAGDGRHRLEIGFSPGDGRSIRLDGAAAQSVGELPIRPLMSVFLPDRLELIKGAPSRRRGHLDSLVAALWPSRAATRASYSQSLSQRNALLTRIRAGGGSPEMLEPWDRQLAEHGSRVIEDREEAVALLARPLSERAGDLGLPGPLAAEYRSRTEGGDAEGLLAELRERRTADVERGFTVFGPHRDDLRMRLGGSALRVYGSQGQQRVGLLALLFAERDVLESERGLAPVMLLDDVMSELDADRRRSLTELLVQTGQSLVTTTEAEHVPGLAELDAQVIELDAATPTGCPAEGSGG